MGRGWKRVEQFLLQLGDVMEQLSLEMYYWRFDQRHFYGNADQFSELCQKLHQLRSVQLTINVQLFDELTDDTVAGFTRSFRTAYWLDGPLGRAVCCCRSSSTVQSCSNQLSTVRVLRHVSHSNCRLCQRSIQHTRRTLFGTRRSRIA